MPQKRSKRYLAALKKLPEAGAKYSIPDAVAILKKFDACRFDENVAQAVKEFKGGKIEYRADASGNVQAPVGKKSFVAEKLAENVAAFIEHIQHSRPSSAKGGFMQKATVSATMSPGVDLAVETA